MPALARIPETRKGRDAAKVFSYGWQTAGRSAPNSSPINHKTLIRKEIPRKDANDDRLLAPGLDRPHPPPSASPAAPPAAPVVGSFRRTSMPSGSSSHSRHQKGAPGWSKAAEKGDFWRRLARARPRQRRGAQRLGLSLGVPSWPEPPGAPRGGARAEPGHCPGATLTVLVHRTRAYPRSRRSRHPRHRPPPPHCWRCEGR